MKYSEAASYAAELRKFADFIDANGVKLPSYGSKSLTMRYYLTVSNYEDTGDVDAEGNKVWNHVVDDVKTKERVREFVLALGSCEKEYRGNQLDITKTFGDNVRIIGQTDRSVTCKKVVTGYKTEPAVNLPERKVEIVEWECDEAPSLLALVKN
jgi:hypothetical protein